MDARATWTLIACLGLAACGFDASFADGYRCGDGDRCPSGSHCVAGVCTAAEGAPDAASDSSAAQAPTPRLITNAWYSDWSGTTFESPAGMAHTGYEVDTSGIVDGDLVLFIASIDNGSDSVWPTPVAPGFQTLAQKFYGHDGQTFVVAWKIADGEPATYTGTYGSGLGSASATITLIAVTGADPGNPIDDFMSATDGGPNIDPVLATSAGVTTTVPLCTIIYAAGVDWASAPGSNTFTPPADYGVLAEIGDRGDSSWDWTSQEIDDIVQPDVGDTGPIEGSFDGDQSGVAWTVAVAIAPPR